MLGVFYMIFVYKKVDFNRIYKQKQKSDKIIA